MFKNYNLNQAVLPLDLEIKLQENNIAFFIRDLVESIPNEAFDSFLRCTSCPAFHPLMMLNFFMCLSPNLFSLEEKLNTL